MKKFKTLRNVIVGASLLFAAASSRPACAWFNGTYMETSTTVQVSTSMVTGATLLLSPGATSSSSDVFIFPISTHTTTASTTYLAIKDSTTVSTSPASGSMRIPFNAVFELRDYNGPLYAIIVGTNAVPVSVLRKK